MSEEEEFQEITLLLRSARDAPTESKHQLIASVYDQLKRVAQQRMNSERPDHTLQATALVHEAWLKMRDWIPEHDWKDRTHFFRAASEAMRRILVDHARKRSQKKRGGGVRPIPLEDLDIAAAESDSASILALDEAFGRLEEEDPRMAEIVRLRVFAGLSIDETAEAVGVSRRTVLREWQFARAWLYEEMCGEGKDENLKP